ncbi:aspartic peptidase domain-containing protein [Blyttiomyces helicus]|uniref:Aspartic peptidase domain-containing protein n=1 Tax=Blyttiomyces helicus TaxID=388810 RepID=A0A4P9W991_9FUNG|nr:aspartic peptidase domain-containing protein [Blyttiomyces helicus]|eukprot:RKO88964.1 aspartic peptidase domain-containing protein [Blyttiomyces helicus]
MKTLLALFALSAIVSAVHAAPTANAPVTVPIFRRPSSLPPFERRSAAARAALEKFSPDGSALARRSEPTGLLNVFDLYYHTNITIGSGQVVQVDLDTGSPDLWVTGPNCEPGPDGGEFGCLSMFDTVNLTDPLIEPTGKNFNDSFSDKSTVAGEIYLATYTFADQTVTDEVIGIAEVETFTPMQISGLLGLSPKLNPSSYKGVYGNNGFPNAKSPTEALGLTSFGFYLSANQDGDEGEFTVNGFDARRVQSKSQTPFTFEPVDWQSGFWKFSNANGGILINNTESKFTIPSSIADTGTTFITLHDDDLPAIYSRVGADAHGKIDCGKSKSGPDIVFKFSDAEYHVPASAYVFFIDFNMCMVGIVGGARSVNVFGDIFLRAQYST